MIENIVRLMPKHNAHKNAKQKARYEWEHTLSVLGLDKTPNCIPPAKKQNFIEDRQYVIELWRKIWNFAITNVINLSAYNGVISIYVDAIYGYWVDGTGYYEQYWKHTNKIPIEFAGLINKMTEEFAELEYRFFHIEYGNDYDETRQKIMELIYNHFESERKKIIETLRTVLPVGVFQLTDTIWSYAFVPIDKQKEEIEETKLKREAEKKETARRSRRGNRHRNRQDMEQQYDTDELSAILSEDSDEN